MTRPRTAPLSTPTLHVYSATESLQSLWPSLAAQCGVTLAEVTHPSALGRITSGIVVIAAAGEERLLPELIPQVGTGVMAVIAVGVDDGRRVAIDTMRAGAAEYFCLPAEVDALRSAIRTLVDDATAAIERDQFASRQQQRHGFEGVYGDSPALLDAVARAQKVIPFEKLTLLLTGESGTGKEVFARAVHYNGPRRTQPFVAVNCAAIPLHLLESELFGHERGAFTGATSAKTGLFEVANGGTLLLDEIGHMDLTLQGKLLRALEERVIRRVGGTKDIAVDLRVLAATHVDLGRAVSRGEFRADLFYRLNVVSIQLPPLRERGNDVLLLAQQFITRVAADYGVEAPALSEAARRRIARHSWPGNVRELRNAMERATLLAADGVIDEKDLEIDERPAPSAPGRLPFPATLGTIIQSAVRETVALHEGNRSEAARRLGISRSRLHRLLGNDGDPT
ncbi:MAG: sigma-54 dependent transcriptional regulator [Gemmatimonadaceae bacterium]|jgi:two-component system response regulator HydG|nr:sigma-54 dependent transcriptional regulator [Gemmatimonadaceae bacterium]